MPLSPCLANIVADRTVIAVVHEDLLPQVSELIHPAHCYPVNVELMGGRGLGGLLLGAGGLPLLAHLA
jgi:hypothetical protein